MTIRFLVFLLLSCPLSLGAQEPFDSLSFYQHLHQNPELSFQEKRTAALLADTLAGFGYTVSRDIGGHGVVAVLENGPGPTVMLRMDTDALPVLEQTGLPYASVAKSVEQNGQEVSVMHACGHDMHMTVVTAVARELAQRADEWSGTLMVIAQPAEERGAGARLMLNDGLFTRFPLPDYNLSLHNIASLPAGKIGYVAGYMMANVDMVDVTIHGVGGHGAYPHNAKDPIVLAAAIIMNLQTLVSREIHPVAPGVVTVGSIHSGTKHNIISDQAHLQITVRSYSDEVRQQLLEGIERIAQNQARAMGFPEDKLPEISVRNEYTPALWNDPELTERSVAAMRGVLGDENLVEIQKEMGGEDFARYGRTAEKIPSFMLRLGTVPVDKYEAALRGEHVLPSLHSPYYAPDPQPTIDTGVRAMTAAVLALF